MSKTKNKKKNIHKPLFAVIEEKIGWKEMLIDILVDIIGGILIAIGIYNFAAEQGFPMVGFNGIALILYQLYRLPIGITVIALNIPAVFLCYKQMGSHP